MDRATRGALEKLPKDSRDRLTKSLSMETPIVLEKIQWAIVLGALGGRLDSLPATDPRRAEIQVVLCEIRRQIDGVIG